MSDNPAVEVTQAEIDRVMRHMISIAHASQRPDGTDIPLGQQCREAADLILRLATRTAIPEDAETVEKVARAIYLEMKLNGNEAKNIGHLEAVFGPKRQMGYSDNGHSARRAALMAIRSLNGGAP